MSRLQKFSPKLSEIRIHPLKSGAARQITTTSIDHTGLKDDRRLMVLDKRDRMITAREHPRLLLVEAWIEPDGIVLMAPGHATLHIHLPGGEQSRTASIWGREVIGTPLGPIADDWISDVIRLDARLLAMGPETHNRGRFNFSDAEPVLLASQESLNDVAARASIPVTMDRFRPNLVVSGAEPFEEDEWASIRIGTVEFDVIGPCDRCSMVSINPTAPLQVPTTEPLATLAAYRRDEKGTVYFGQLLRPRSQGRINVCDTVTVLARRGRPQFMSHAKPIAMAMRPADQLSLKCVGILDETPIVKTFRFVPENALMPKYQPGQHIRIGVDVGSSIEHRCYTLSSSPSRPAFLSITVKKEGLVSSALHDTMRIGDRITATTPIGQFHLMAKPAAKILLLSAGSGITPFLSMLTWMADTDISFDVVFDVSFPTMADAIASQELVLIEKQLGSRLRIERRFTQQGHDRIDRTAIIDICPDIRERAVYACGPASYINVVRTALASIEGFDLRNLLIESFGGSALPTGADTDLGALRDEVFQLRFTRSDVTVEARGSQTILGAARSVGVGIQAGCEAGLCGSCRVRVSAGSWALSPQCADFNRSVLSDAEKAQHVVLACTTCPTSMMEIDL